MLAAGLRSQKRYEKLRSKHMLDIFIAFGLKDGNEKGKETKSFVIGPLFLPILSDLYILISSSAQKVLGLIMTILISEILPLSLPLFLLLLLQERHLKF